MRAADAAPSTVRDPGDPTLEYVDDEERRSHSAAVEGRAAGEVEERLRDLQPELEHHFGIPLLGFRRPQYLVYRPGDFFQPHRDARDDQDSAPPETRREVSVVVFVNGNASAAGVPAYEGGQLSFFGLFDQDRGVGLPVTAAPGLVVAFRSSLLHGVSRVTHGARYTLVTWFY
jgi:predicted 2-oxoglutarate/Fe(II)-dependent dioxygenase YbiX